MTLDWGFQRPLRLDFQIRRFFKHVLEDLVVTAQIWKKNRCVRVESGRDTNQVRETRGLHHSVFHNLITDHSIVQHNGSIYIGLLIDLFR
jgi:hypothetical protein